MASGAFRCVTDTPGRGRYSRHLHDSLGALREAVDVVRVMLGASDAHRAAREVEATPDPTSKQPTVRPERVVQSLERNAWRRRSPVSGCGSPCRSHVSGSPEVW